MASSSEEMKLITFDILIITCNAYNQNIDYNFENHLNKVIPLKYTDNIVFGLEDKISNNTINVINEFIKSNNLTFDIQSLNF